MNQETNIQTVTVVNVLSTGTAFGFIDALKADCFIPAHIKTRHGLELNDDFQAIIGPNEHHTTPFRVVTIPHKALHQAVTSAAPAKTDAQIEEERINAVIRAVHESDYPLTIDAICKDADLTLGQFQSLEGAIRKNPKLIKVEARVDADRGSPSHKFLCSPEALGYMIAEGGGAA